MSDATDLKAELLLLRQENKELREDLEFERSENGWAREFLNRMGRKCGTKDCPSLVAYVTKLEDENKELRELALTLAHCAAGHGCDICPLNGKEGIVNALDMCDGIHDRMRQLVVVK